MQPACVDSDNSFECGKIKENFLFIDIKKKGRKRNSKSTEFVI